jgi:queuosine precursor transporter
MKQKHSTNATLLTTTGVLVVAAYTAAQMLSDVLSLKIALVAGFSIDAGTFVYPFTFTLRDLVHKLLGRSAARAVIVAAAAINLVMAGLFAFAAWLPPDPTWTLQSEFAAVLTPVWRIVVASIAAELVSEFTDTEVYHLWVTRVTRHYQWARVLVSNAVSVPLDSLIFCWGAFGGLLPAATVWSIFWANVLVKGAVTLVSLPGIYLVPETEGQGDGEMGRQGEGGNCGAEDSESS